MQRIRRYNLTAALCAAAVIPAAAAVVSGTLFDPALGEGEPFATVRIYQASDTVKPKAVIVTDIDGRFSHELTPGDYRLTFSALGKKTAERSVAVARTDVSLDTIPMLQDALSLAEVEVTAARPLVRMKADEMSYSVADDTEARTLSLLDLLRKVPMVTVDGNDNITVNGSSSFKVYVDGKPSLLFSGNPGEIFKAMPASSVLSIDVVTNPGARYDAEGAAGILNIVMNRTAATPDVMNRAYNVSATLRGGLKGFGGNVYATAALGKVSASLNVMYNQNRPGTSDTETLLGQADGSTLTTTGTGKPRMPFTMVNYSMQYQPDTLTVIGASVAYNRFHMTSKGTTATLLDGTPLYTSVTDMMMDRQGINAGVDLTRDFGPKRNQQLQVAYRFARESGDNETQSAFTTDLPGGMPPRLSDNSETTNDHIILADYKIRPSEAHTVSAGAKASLRRAESKATGMLGDVADPTDYVEHNNIGAVYGEYAFSSGAFGAKAGLRYEHTHQKVRWLTGQAADFSTDYGILVPSASLSYSAGQASNWGLNYNMRISRPGISYLNPFVDRSDPTRLTYGNPDLDVEKSHNVSLVYNLMLSKLNMNLTLTESHTGNGIERYSFMDADGLLNTTYGNIVRRNSLRLSTFVAWNPSSKTRIQVNGSVGYTDFRSDELDVRRGGWQANGMLSVQQTLPADFRVGAMVFASTRSTTLQGWNGGFSMLSVNASKSFFKDLLNLSLGFTTGLGKNGRSHFTSYSAGQGFSNRTSMSIPMTNVTLSATIRFGSGRTPAVRSKVNAASDYIEQQSQMEQISTQQGQ